MREIIKDEQKITKDGENIIYSNEFQIKLDEENVSKNMIYLQNNLKQLKGMINQDITKQVNKKVDEMPSGVFKVCIYNLSDEKPIQTCFNSELEARDEWEKQKSTLKKARLLRYKYAVYNTEEQKYTGSSEILDSIGW